MEQLLQIKQVVMEELIQAQEEEVEDGLVLLDGAGGSGVVIIRYLKKSNETKKELFNFITNEVRSEYGALIIIVQLVII